MGQLDLRCAARHFAWPFGLALLTRLCIEPQLVLRAPLLFAACLAILVFVTLLPRLPLGAQQVRWQALLLFLVALNGGYQASGRFMRTAAGWRGDEALHAIDIILLGGRDAQSWLAALNAPWLSDLLALAYAFFLVLLPVVSLYYVFAGSDARRQRYWRGLMTVYGCGLGGYFLLPAAGPYLHHPALLAPLAHGFVSAPIHAFIAEQSTGVDVWPSLHCAVTLYIQLWLWRAAPRFGHALLVPTLLVILSTLYLQYHYFIDVLCGIALALIAAWIAREKDLEPSC